MPIFTLFCKTISLLIILLLLAAIFISVTACTSRQTVTEIPAKENIVRIPEELPRFVPHRVNDSLPSYRDAESGLLIRVFPNTLIITFEQTASVSDIKDIFSTFDLVAVSFVPENNEYEVRTVHDRTMKDLNQIVNQLNDVPFVKNASTVVFVSD